MWDGVPLTILSSVSPWAVTAGIALVVVRLIYTGKLVPYSTLLVYKEALEAERAANAELRAALKEGGYATKEAVTHLFESIQRPPQEGDG